MTDRIQRILLYVIAALFCVALVSYCVTLPFGAVTWYDNVVINEMARGGITHKALGRIYTWVPSLRSLP